MSKRTSRNLFSKQELVSSSSSPGNTKRISVRQTAILVHISENSEIRSIPLASLQQKKVSDAGASTHDARSGGFSRFPASRWKRMIFVKREIGGAKKRVIQTDILTVAERRSRIFRNLIGLSFSSFFFF